MKSFFRDLSIKKKLVLLVFLAMLVSTIVFTLQLYHTDEEALLRGIDDNLETAAYGVSYIVPPEYHARIEDKNSISPEEYLEKQAELQAYVRQAGLRYLYTVMQSVNKVVFTADIEDPFFLPYDSAPEDLYQAFIDGEIHYAQYTDDYGTFRSVFIPLKTANEKVFVIGADIQVDFIQRELQGVAVRSILFGLGIFVFFILATYLVISRISKPVLSLTAAAQAIQKGELSEDEISRLSQSRGKDEVSTLSRVFAKMAAEVKAREAKLKKQVEELKIEIDHSKKARQVAEITDTDYFQNLKQKAKQMREKKGHAD